jgi:hypothetical protein
VIFIEGVRAGASIAAAAVRAGFDPWRIPVRLAPHAPSILAGIPPHLLEAWEEDGRVPPGTAQIARDLHSEPNGAT